jgi:cell division protein FtsL
MTKIKKRLKMSKFERLLYSFTLFLLFTFPLLLVFTKATLSQVNYEVEKVKDEIATQTKTNESLTMKIDELVSLNNIQIVASNEGLSYNNNNIKSISE